MGSFLGKMIEKLRVSFIICGSYAIISSLNLNRNVSLKCGILLLINAQRRCSLNPISGKSIYIAIKTNFIPACSTVFVLYKAVITP